MTAATLAQTPSSPKVTHGSLSKSSVTRTQGNEGANFENELNEASSSSENGECSESSEPTAPPLIDNEVTIDPNSASPSTEEPVQTLFPTQMAIQVVETQAPTENPEKESNGIIFPNAENKSPSFKPELLNGATVGAKTSLASNPTELPSLNENPENNPIQSTPPLSSEQAKSATPTNSKVLELLASVRDSASLQEKETSLDLKTVSLNPMESLKSSTTQAKPESITLSSQHRLETVLDSVFEETPLPTPRRIEVKLQTPQGSQITLYIARVNQELRAQFSANSHQAMAWLQSEIGQLRTLNSAESVRWLPAQMEATIAKSESSGKSSDKKSDKEKDREANAPLESIFDLLKPSTRRLA